MKLKFYSFHDALTNGYSQPFLQNNRAQAVRTARWKANESKPSELVELGEFDTETGYMSEAMPEHIARLIDLKETANVKS
jgi:hypothetical protein